MYIYCFFRETIIETFVNSEERTLVKSINGSSHRRCSVKEDVLKSFANFTGKHLCSSQPFVIKLIFDILKHEIFQKKKNASEKLLVLRHP